MISMNLVITSNLFIRAALRTALFSSFVMLFVTMTSAQQPAALSQQIYVLKQLEPKLKTIGVMGSSISDKEMQDISRLGLSQGIEFVFARPKSPQEISLLYNQMVAQKKIQMIWLPYANDETMLGIGFQFLRENTPLDKIGLCAPKKPLVESGALCSVQKEEGKVVVYLNKKSAELLDIKVPASDPNSPVIYIVL